MVDNTVFRFPFSVCGYKNLYGLPGAPTVAATGRPMAFVAYGDAITAFNLAAMIRAANCDPASLKWTRS